MNGKIFEINPKRGMVAVQTDNGDFSVFELLSEEDIEIGDPVHWRNDTGMGSETLTNLRSGQRFEVYFQNHWVSKSNLRKQLLLE